MRAVQLVKKTLVMLLATQLMAVFGLCGFVCCPVAGASDFAETAPPSRTQPDSHAEHQALQQAKNHCHAKPDRAGPMTEPHKPQERSGHAASHCHSGHTGRSIALVSGQFCQCDFNTNERSTVAVAQTDASPQKGRQIAFATFPIWHSAIQLRPTPSASPPTLVSHALPYSGFQRALRI